VIATTLRRYTDRHRWPGAQLRPPADKGLAYFRPVLAAEGAVCVMRDGLAKINLFADLTAEERRAISSDCVWQEYPKQTEIIGHQDRSTHVFFILDGHVNIVVCTPNGRDVIFRQLKAGQHFGEFAAIDGRPRSASVVAVSHTRIARMDALRFRRILDEHPGVKDRLLTEFVGLVRQMSERIFEFSAVAVQNRVQAELLRLAYEAGVTNNTARLTAPPTHESLAARVSTHREAVSREISRLHRLGILERQGRTWVVVDVSGLSSLVHDAVGLPIGVPPST
jgi:CRP-like cAMP-binding protein